MNLLNWWHSERALYSPERKGHVSIESDVGLSCLDYSRVEVAVAARRGVRKPERAQNLTTVSLQTTLAFRDRTGNF